MSESNQSTAGPAVDPIAMKRLDAAIQRLEAASAKTKLPHQRPLIDQAQRVLALPGGVQACRERIERIDRAGLFLGTDWAEPARLKPVLVRQTLEGGEASALTLEILSELRFLAIAAETHPHPTISAEQARRFLAQVLGLNLERLFGTGTEVARRAPADLTAAVNDLFALIVDQIGHGRIVDQVIAEVWRIQAQRPIHTQRIKDMVTQLAVWMAGNPAETSASGWGADRLISALFGPTRHSREDPGIDAYADRLLSMDDQSLVQETAGMARAMHDTGLVSPYHAVLLRYLASEQPDLLPDALGLSATGRDSYLSFQDLTHALIEQGVFVETCQAIYGLALLHERGVLYLPPTAPALWRQIRLRLAPGARARLVAAHGTAPSPEAWLLAGVISVLGQPLGVGQGNNPTCQAARAISMWSHADPDYLLQLVAWAARDDEVLIPFEGQMVSSAGLSAGLATGPLVEVDPVSTVLVPHLDRIYVEMGRLCAQRGGDPHEWINPEMHGWWVGRRFDIVVEVATGRLIDVDGFIRRFYAAYHPGYNGGQPVIHPSPAGIAVTDSAARFVGWHAIAIYRVGLDPNGCVRVYFFNPNNDGGQDWGGGIHVSTEGHGEVFGESSVPIQAFAARLYIFHSDPLETGAADLVPQDEVTAIRDQIVSSWGRDRV